MRCLLLLLALGLGLGLLAPPMASAQIPDLKALERELERRKEEQARQEAEARRRAEAAARRRAEAEARRRTEEQAEAEAQRRAEEEEARRHAEMLAGPRWNQFERVSDGVMDWGQNVIWATQDNGREVNWRDAQAHCRTMGSGWSLPSVAQLQSLYARDTPHRRQVLGVTIYPATNLIQFTGWFFWSAESRGSSQAWGVILGNGSRVASLQSSSHSYYRALCVRRP